MTGPTRYTVSDSSRDQPASDETATVEASLRRLAGSSDEAVISQATAAVDDLDAAVSFVETVGLAELERAVEAVEDPSTRERGTAALETFLQYRRAATDDVDSRDYFHDGYRTDLSRGDQGSSR